MATRRGRLREAFAQVLTRSMTSTGETLAHWLRRIRSSSTTVATRFWTSTREALRHWLNIWSTDDDGIVDVAAETENLGTEEDPIDLPKIYLKKGDLLLFEKV